MQAVRDFEPHVRRATFRGSGDSVLLAEAVIAEIMAAVFVGYSSIKRIKGSEGVAVAALTLCLVVLFFVPLTAHFLA
jgi:hypothetical protein